MNERIRQLAVMANPSSKEIYEADNWQYNCAAWDSNNLTKFAELIVQECQHRVEQYINECGEVASMPESVIMKHFGVEE